jgi:hypothetical protein
MKSPSSSNELAGSSAPFSLYMPISILLTFRLNNGYSWKPVSSMREKFSLSDFSLKFMRFSMYYSFLTYQIFYIKFLGAKSIKLRNSTFTFERLSIIMRMTKEKFKNMKIYIKKIQDLSKLKRNMERDPANSSAIRLTMIRLLLRPKILSMIQWNTMTELKS